MDNVLGNAGSRMLSAATRTIFGSLTALRGERIFHPDGVAFEATLDVRPNEEVAPTTALLGQAGSHRALVRFSRGLGVPQPIPDILGMAVKLVDAHGPGDDQDFLLVTSGDGPVIHHLLRPATGFLAGSFSSLLSYRIDERLLLVGAMPDGRPAVPRGHDLDEVRAAAATGSLRYRLAVASPWGRWRPVGELTVGAELDAAAADGLRFNPWNTGGGIRPAGPLNALRHPAYESSQASRETADAPPGPPPARGHLSVVRRSS